ncbi:MAG: hypothetical protein U0990_11400 [Candidatus Nanopelagicales bacterium]|nr:hypothetical protein [Candidatus Nanopelagicales bacterium]MDZ4250672.1 hypothetical protein [Candidatus Nanopelagicales bacterium]
MSKVDYTAEVTREGRWWVAQVAPIDYATQCRRLSDMRRQVADLVETVTGEAVDPGSIKLDVRLPGTAQASWDEALRLRETAAATQAKAAAQARVAAKDLADAGLSVRDIGTALGVSFQRAHQLISG